MLSAKRVCVLFIFVFIFAMGNSASFAQDPVQLESLIPKVRLYVKPKVCVLSERESLCKDRIKIVWHASDEISPCLFQEGRKAPLHCWKNKKKGRYQFHLVTENSVKFILKPYDEAIQLASSEFEVLKNQLKYRHRRRNSWSFF